MVGERDLSARAVGGRKLKVQQKNYFILDCVRQLPKGKPTTSSLFNILS